MHFAESLSVAMNFCGKTLLGNMSHIKIWTEEE